MRIVSPFLALLSCALISSPAAGTNRVGQTPVLLRACNAPATSPEASDFNNDGCGDLFVGAYAENIQDGPDDIPDAGSVNVLYGTGNGLRSPDPGDPPALGLPDQFWHQGQPGIPSDPGGDEGFGRSVAAGNFNDDDFMDLAVSVYEEDVTVGGSTIIDAGAVHVFYGSSAGLQKNSPAQQFIDQDTLDGYDVADRPQALDFFGRTLAAGDFDADGYDDLAIGADLEDVLGPDLIDIMDAGSVNVLYGSASGLQAGAPGGRDDQFWTQDSTNVEDDAEELDQWGQALAAGDFNDDDASDLAIGAVREDIGSLADAGGVNVLYGSTTNGLQATSAPNDFFSQDYPSVKDVAESDDWFGRDLEAGDFDGDTEADLAIGAWHEDVEREGAENENAGAVHIFYGSAAGLQASGGVAGLDDQFWHQGTQLNGQVVLGTLQELDFFGRELAVGDFDADGEADLAIGAWGEDIDGEMNAGAVNVLYGSSSSGLQANGVGGREDEFFYQGFVDGGNVIEGTAQLDEELGKGLGAADYNGDDIPDLAMGAWRDNISEGVFTNDAGSVNVLYGSTGSGLQLASPPDEYWYQGKLDADNNPVEDLTEAGDRFGFGLG